MLPQVGSSALWSLSGRWPHLANCRRTAGHAAADDAARAPGSGPARRPAADAQPGQLVVDVIIEGEHTSKDYEIQKHIHTRKDREFDADILQGDVRRLVTSGLFRDVKTYTAASARRRRRRSSRSSSGPASARSSSSATAASRDKKLLKEIGVKKGDPLNSYAAEESRRKIEELYHSERLSQGHRDDLRRRQAGRQGPDLPDQRRPARADFGGRRSKATRSRPTAC